MITDVSIIHVTVGSSSPHLQRSFHLKGTLSHPNAPDGPLALAFHWKITKYRNSWTNNHSISFSPALTSSHARMHGEFLRRLFLQAHRETQEYFRFMGMPAQLFCCAS